MPSKLAEAPRRVVAFDVYGTPAPKGSGRAILVAGRARHVPSGSDVNRDALREWDRAVRNAARLAIGDGDGAPMFVNTALYASMVFYMRRPKGHYRKDGTLKPNAPARPRTKPDTSKLGRATEDSLTGIVWDDDGRVADLVLSKRWAERPGQEGARITVTEAVVL